jgi:hypothetical protein
MRSALAATSSMWMIRGMPPTITFLVSLLKTPSLFWINPCVAGMTSDQVRTMLKADLDARPGDGHLPMVHRAVYQILWKACRHSPEK